jgi:DNA (cytosine-5)-methyltransferase 1
MGRPVAIDLFSGCGGLTLGLKRAGFDVLASVEIDELSAETYRLNHPEVKIWNRDIRELKIETVKRKLRLRVGELDLLAGCPPCQGYSSIRTLNGSRVVEDSRNDLVFEFLRFIKGFKPKAVMMENVPGLILDDRMKSFLQEIEELGYQGEPRVLDAADYGVPQRRKRMILLAGRLGTVKYPPPCRKVRTVRETIGSLCIPGDSGDELHDLPERRSARIMQMITRIPKDGGGRTDLAEDEQLECHKKTDGFRDIYGRMAWDDVAPTLTGGCVNPSKGRFLHPEQNRAITLREAALLQSFPPRYSFSVENGKMATAELIGNAYPPEFAKRQARSVAKYLRSIKEIPKQ